MIDVRLEGSFPETEMVIRYLDLRDGYEKSYRERIWEMSDGTDAEYPEEVAIEISIQFGENY